MLVTTLAACARADAPSTSHPVIEDSAGVQIVRNGTIGTWGPDTPHIEQLVRIGAVEGEEAYQFHQIYSLAMDAEGILYVGNNQTGSVRVFRPDGSFVREFGRKGRGPGEYSMINRVWLAGDSIGVTDWQGGGKTGIYTKQGELTAFWTARRPDRTTILPQAKTPSGWLAFHVNFGSVPELDTGERWVREQPLVRFDPETDSVGAPTVRVPGQVLYGSPDTHGLDWALFAPNPAHGFDGAGRTYVSPGDPYRIEVFDDDGALNRVVTRDYDPVPLGDRDVAELKALIIATYDTVRRATGQQERESALTRVDHQRSYDPRTTVAPLGNLLVSPDGSFWLERADAARPAAIEYEKLYGDFDGRPRPTRWDLFDADGRFLSSVDLPASFRPLAVRGTDVAGVLRDDLDVEYVVVYRVSRP